MVYMYMLWAHIAPAGRRIQAENCNGAPHHLQGFKVDRLLAQELLNGGIHALLRTEKRHPEAVLEVGTVTRR